MEAATLTPTTVKGRRASGSPLLRLQPDDRLVTMTRRGDQAAFEDLVSRYQSKLLGFCRHMLGNREDAEDVLQEVFAAAYTAMLADDREIMVKPWFYRIARNRSLNHMRRAKAVGVDSMDIHVSEFGLSTADRAQNRAEFLGVMKDIAVLPETQRTALLLREIDGLPYEQIAEVMDTTVPSVKSLLVRARVALAEMTEARSLTCNEVRIELGEIAEGLLRKMTPPVRRHIKSCDRCKDFKAQLTATDVALSAMAPVGLLVAAKNLLATQFGLGGSGSTAATGSLTAAGSAAGGSVGGSLATTISAGATAIASKAAAGIAAAAIVTAGAVQVEQTVVHAPATVAAAAIAKPVTPAAATLELASRPAPVIAAPATPAAAEALAVAAVATAPIEAATAPAPEVVDTTPVAAPTTATADTGQTLTISEGTDVSMVDAAAPTSPDAIAPEAPEVEPAATDAPQAADTSTASSSADPAATAQQ